MDVISEAIGTIRIGGVNARRIRLAGPWGVRYPGFAGCGFHIVLSGHGWLATATDRPRAVRPGDVILAPSGAGHGLSHVPRTLDELPPGPLPAEAPPDGPADIELLCGAYRLGHGQVHHYLRSLPAVIVVSPDYDHDPQLRSLADLLGADTASHQPGQTATRAALLDLLLVHVLRQWLKQHRAPDWPPDDDPAVATALRQVHRDPRSPWTVEQLSQAAGLSRTAFSKRFTTQLGRSPRAYLTSVRLAQGARLLRETAAPLATIAHQVGYATEFSFSAAFRREYGVAPGRFRVTEPPLPRGAHEAAHASRPAANGTAGRDLR